MFSVVITNLGSMLRAYGTDCVVSGCNHRIPELLKKSRSGECAFLVPLTLLKNVVKVCTNIRNPFFIDIFIL